MVVIACDVIVVIDIIVAGSRHIQSTSIQCVRAAQVNCGCHYRIVWLNCSRFLKFCKSRLLHPFKILLQNDIGKSSPCCLSYPIMRIRGFGVEKLQYIVACWLYGERMHSEFLSYKWVIEELVRNWNPCGVTSSFVRHFSKFSFSNISIAVVKKSPSLFLTCHPNSIVFLLQRMSSKLMFSRLF